MDTLGATVRTALPCEDTTGSGRDPDGRGPWDAAPSDATPPDPDEAVEADLEIEDGDTTLFEAAITAFHAHEFERAESLFLEEAERTIADAPQRAAIAFRQAALAARESGNLDGSDHWMRLAGREYLRVSEDPRTPLPFIRESAVMAAKCFLNVQNLHVATTGLRRAQAIDSVLRADDDMMAGATGIPFRHDGAAAVSRSGADGGGDRNRPVGGRSADVDSPTTTVGIQPIGPLPPEATDDGTDQRAGWLERLRGLLPSHDVV